MDADRCIEIALKYKRQQYKEADRLNHMSDYEAARCHKHAAEIIGTMVAEMRLVRATAS